MKCEMCVDHTFSQPWWISSSQVCKGYRDAQQELCDCMAPEAASASADARLTDFYTKYAPQRSGGEIGKLSLGV